MPPEIIVVMPESSTSLAAAQPAVDRANREIRAYVRGLPPYRVWTPEQRARYDVLLDRFNDARVALAAARAREGEDDPVPAAA
jgi:hypothetical protein